MEIKKAIKKIAAISAGAFMVGATLMGAMAYDLANYPSEIMEDGVLNAVLVYGDTASASDAAALASIAVGLQSTIGAPVAPGEVTTVEGGVKIERTTDRLNLGETLNDIQSLNLDESDMAVLKGGSVVDEDGKEYKYTLEIAVDPLNTIGVDFARNMRDGKGRQRDPVTYLDFSNGRFDLIWEFASEVDDITDLANEEVVLFGRTYTFAGDKSELNLSQENEFVLYAASVDEVIEAGETKTIQVAGEPVEVTVHGVVDDGSGATITVNGERRSVKPETSYPIGGQRVYVRDIQAYTIPAAAGAVRLYLGADKLIIPRDGTVEIGDGADRVHGVESFIEPVGVTNAVEKVTFRVTPSDMRGDDHVTYLEAGDSVVDPLFGAIQYTYAGSNLPIDSAARESILVEKTDDEFIALSFTNRQGVEYSFDAIWFNATDNSYNYVFNDEDTQLHLIDGVNTVLEDEAIVITSPDANTRIVELIRADDDGTDIEVEFRDVSTGDTWSRTGKTASLPLTIRMGGGNYEISAVDDRVSVDIAPEGEAIIGKAFTQNGGSIDFPGGGVLVFSEYAEIGGRTYVVDSEIENQLPAGYAGITITPADDGTEITALNVASVDLDMKPYDSIDDMRLGLTPAGTFVERNTDSDSAMVEIFYAGDETTYDVYVAPVDARVITRTTGGVAGGVIDTSKLVVASMANTAGQNVIAVGGPCVNSVAAELLGNPEVCTEGFEEGRAMIKAFDKADGKVAILVAGMTATDTERAGRVLADFSAYELSGSEVEVITVTDSVTIVS